MNSFGIKSVWALLGAVLVALAITAIYNSTHVTSLHLPISTAALALSVILPIAQLSSGIWFLTSSKVQTTIALNLAWVLSVLDAALIAIASVQLSDEYMGCSLETRWRQWFQDKDASAIKSIQNSLECCGFRSSRDKAWPFPSKSRGVDACVVSTGRENSCFVGMSNEAKVGLRLLIVVGSLSLLVKLAIGLGLQIRRQSMRELFPRSRAREAERQRLIEHHGDEEEPESRYTDEPSTSAA